MICPHCNYEHGWSAKPLEVIDGEYGDFYKLPVKLEREGFYQDFVSLYGCPCCNKTFIDKFN